MVDKARRPYLDLDNTETLKPGTPQRPLETSLVRTPSRYLSTSLDRESEFEKPYLGTSPRKQHLDPPGPDWPDIPGFPPGTIPPITGDPVGPGCPACALAFDAIYDCEKDWGEAHAMIYCSMQPGTDCPDCTMQITAIVGEIVDIQPGTWSRRLDPLVWNSPFGWRADLPQNQGRQSLPPTTGTMSLKVKVNPLVEKHVLIAEMIDGAGNYCRTHLDVTCGCECPAKITFIIDTANSDSVTSGKKASVAVLGGCPQYIWSISGTGWSIAPDGASDLMAATVTVNTSVCNDATSVALGIVTIVDNCGTIQTHTIKHQGGVWEDTALCSFSGVWECSGGVTGTDTAIAAGELIVGGYKYKWANVAIGGAICGYYGSSPPPDSKACIWTWGACGGHPPPYGVVEFAAATYGLTACNYLGGSRWPRVTWRLWTWGCP